MENFLPKVCLKHVSNVSGIQGDFKLTKSEGVMIGLKVFKELQIC